jgi:signal transduction histidine kinase
VRIDDVIRRVQGWLRRHPWVGELAFAVALAAAVLPVSVGMIRDGGVGPGWTVSLCAALGAMHAGLCFRVRAPVIAFAVAAAAELLLATAPYLTDPDTAATYPAVLLPSSTAYLVAAYSLSVAGRGAWPVLSLLVGVAGSLIVTVRVWLSGSAPALTAGDSSDLLFLTGLLLAMVVAAWALGRFRRLRTEQMVALLERARRAESDRDRSQREAAADERGRIARELHDVIAHSVSVMVRQAEGGRFVAAKDPEAAAATLATIADTGREALNDIRTMLGVLDAESGPAERGPQPTVESVPELVERLRASGQPVRLRVEGEPQPLDRSAHLAAYRLVQEALTNVVKHAGPDVETEVVLAWDADRLQVRVTDQGAPFRATDGMAPGGRGLVGMRERVQLVGGTLSVGPARSGGFAVHGEIPTAAARGRRGRGESDER